jgi:hypothetical protein
MMTSMELERQKREFEALKDVRPQTRGFNHKGIRVIEYIWKTGPDSFKIAWRRHPVAQTMFDGLMSPLLHANYSCPFADYSMKTNYSKSLEDHCRQTVRMKFEEYWGLT